MYRSAYFHFSRINNSTVKEELIREGKDAGLGALQSAVAAKVHLTALNFTNLFVIGMRLQIVL